jgi:uncharacterized membrane protein YdjX (TVP38/TMEM64 family)
MILVTALQVVIAFIPGELVEVAAGYVFGGLWGTVFVLIGAMLGSVIAILLTRKFGLKLFYTFFPDTDPNSLPILNKPAQRNAMTFLLFFIPGTPKDMLTYVLGLTPMKLSTCLFITVVARIPSVITSVIGGSALGEQNYWLAVIVFAVTGLISLCGILYYNRKYGKKTPKE